jgi:hypothetical protein
MARAATRLYRLAGTEDEAWRRVERRNLNLEGSLFIHRNTFEVLKSRFEPLGDDEKRIELGLITDEPHRQSPSCCSASASRALFSQFAHHLDQVGFAFEADSWKVRRTTTRSRTRHRVAVSPNFPL